MSKREGSKMLNWIKKRCRRRSAPSDKSDYEEITRHFETSMLPAQQKSGYEEITTHKSSGVKIHPQFTVDTTNYLSEENLYEEVKAPMPNGLESSKIIEKLSSLTTKIENDFKSHEVCPMCRQNIVNDSTCVSCILQTKHESVTKKRKADYSQADIDTCNDISDLTRPLPKLPRTISNSISTYSDVSSGYESLGSDLSSEDGLDSRVSEDFESYYEEIKPRVELKRFHSMNNGYVKQRLEKHPNSLYRVQYDGKVKTQRKVSRGKKISFSFRN